MALTRRNVTDGVAPLLPGPEPPEPGAPPGPPSDPLDFGDDASPPSKEQTLHHLLHPIKKDWRFELVGMGTCRKPSSGGPRARMYGMATAGGA